MEDNITTIPEKVCYVTMTDKFMSGWGKAEGKTNKLVIGASSWDDCSKIEKNAKLRSEMKYINTTGKKPYFNSKQFLVSYKNFEDLGEIWKKP